jgi:hypothetical protein
MAAIPSTSQRLRTRILSLVCNSHLRHYISTEFNHLIARLSRDWKAPIYAFFHPIPDIGYVKGRRCHSFRCMNKRCTASVRRFLDKKDASSTSNMRKHVKSCWGINAVSVTDQASDVTGAREVIKQAGLTDGSITAAFSVKGKDKLTYSTRQLTKTETR